MSFRFQFIIFYSLQSADLPQFEETTYELSYNVGTTLAMRGKYSEALPVLKKAEQACSESVLEDGGTEEEAKEEAAIIRFIFYNNHLSNK